MFCSSVREVVKRKEIAEDLGTRIWNSEGVGDGEATGSVSGERSQEEGEEEATGSVSGERSQEEGKEEMVA